MRSLAILSILMLLLTFTSCSSGDHTCSYCGSSYSMNGETTEDGEIATGWNATCIDYKGFSRSQMKVGTEAHIEIYLSKYGDLCSKKCAKESESPCVWWDER